MLTGGASAATIQVNSAIVNDHNLVAAADSFDTVPGDKPGDNGNAIAIANLQSALTMSGSSTTFGNYYQSLVSDVGHMVQQADSYYSHQTQMVQQLDNYRESISGVSIDEEMANLVKYQNAYEAAAKLINVADRMLETLLTIV
jgi:flagellar hook-associated protein 1 FlgK